MCLDNPADHKNKLVHLGAQDILMVGQYNCREKHSICKAYALTYSFWMVVAQVVAQVVAHWTKDEEVPNSIPAGARLFSLLFTITQSLVHP